MNFNGATFKGEVALEDAMPGKNAITKWVYTGNATHTCPAGKKWIVVHVWALSKTATTSQVELTDATITSRELVNCGSANQLQTMSAQPVVVLEAGHYLYLLANSGSAGFTYYEVDA